MLLGSLFAASNLAPNKPEVLQKLGPNPARFTTLHRSLAKEPQGQHQGLMTEVLGKVQNEQLIPGKLSAIRIVLINHKQIENKNLVLIVLSLLFQCRKTFQKTFCSKI